MSRYQCDVNGSLVLIYTVADKRSVDDNCLIIRATSCEKSVLGHMRTAKVQISLQDVLNLYIFLACSKTHFCSICPYITLTHPNTAYSMPIALGKANVMPKH